MDSANSKQGETLEKNAHKPEEVKLEHNRLHTILLVGARVRPLFQFLIWYTPLFCVLLHTVDG